MPQMKAEKDVKNQIGQKENVFKPAEVRANIEKASTQSSTLATSNSIIDYTISIPISSTSANTNAIKNANSATNPNQNASSSTNASTRANNPSNISSANTNSHNSASDPALELPRRLGELNRMLQQQI